MAGRTVDFGELGCCQLQCGGSEFTSVTNVDGDVKLHLPHAFMRVEVPQKNSAGDISRQDEAQDSGHREYRHGLSMAKQEGLGLQVNRFGVFGWCDVP